MTENQFKPTLRDMQLAVASLWLEVAKISKDKMYACNLNYTDTAKFWQGMVDFSTRKAVEHMRAGLHKKRERELS
jgi:hypothetical protein